MKKLLLITALLLPLFGISQQKHLLDSNWPRPRVIGGLYYMFNLEEHGSLFYEQVVLNPMSAAMKLTYISADGNTFWVSDKIKHNSTNHCDVLWDDDGITVFDIDKSKLFFCHLNYKGEVTGKGEVKFESPVMTLFRWQKSTYAVLESEKKDLVQVFIQELNSKTMSPKGTARQAELPEGKRGYSGISWARDKGEVENRWVFAGSNGGRLAFYGKKADIAESSATFDIVITDYNGKKLHGFSQTLAFKSKTYLNRTWKSQEHLRWAKWNVEYQPSEYNTQMNFSSGGDDIGTFGECMVDWKEQAVYFYGGTNEAPEGVRCKAETGYFIQKFSFSGEQKWSEEGKFPESAKKAPTISMVGSKSELMYISLQKNSVLYRHFPEVEVALDAAGAPLLKKNIDLSRIKKDYSDAGQPLHFDTNKLHGFFHFEIEQTGILPLFFATETANALQTLIEKIGHPTSWYIIQVNEKYCTVLETDPNAKEYTVWTMPIGR